MPLNQIIYMYKEDLALNNLQWLISYKSISQLAGAVEYTNCFFAEE